MSKRSVPEHHVDRSMSVATFFEYLHDHEATTHLAKALGEVVMLRTCGVGANPPANNTGERLAS